MPGDLFGLSTAMSQSLYPWFPALTLDLSAQVSRISPRLSRPAGNHADILLFSSQSIGQLSSPDSPIAPRSSQSHAGPVSCLHTPASQLQRVRSLTTALPPQRKRLSRGHSPRHKEPPPAPSSLIYLQPNLNRRYRTSRLRYEHCHSSAPNPSHRSGDSYAGFR